MAIHAKYAHTNIIADDWQKLARFYERVFGCTPILPERELSGKWLEDGTGVTDAKISGIHLSLPGYGDEGPTLEIFRYNHQLNRPDTAINRPGFAHIAFAVDDVELAHRLVIEEGGGIIEKIISKKIEGMGKISFAYVTDPEGNIIELQRWSN